MDEEQSIVIETEHRDGAIWLAGEIDERAACVVGDALLDANSVFQKKNIPIRLFIQSRGGGLNEALAIRDLIKASIRPVMTIVYGYAYSAAALISAAGERGMRFISPSSMLMIHDISGVMVGKGEELFSTARNLKQWKKILVGVLSEDSNLSKAEIKHLISDGGNTDHFMSPRETVKAGFADHIGIPMRGFE